MFSLVFSAVTSLKAQAFLKFAFLNTVITTTNIYAYKVNSQIHMHTWQNQTSEAFFLWQGRAKRNCAGTNKCSFGIRKKNKAC